MHSNSPKSYINFENEDYYNFSQIANQVFVDFDNGIYKSNIYYYKNSSHAPNDNNNLISFDDSDLQKLFDKYDVSFVYIINDNSIMFSCGAYFQQTGGVIITRNNVTPSSYYPNMGFDNDNVRLHKISDGIYSYTAGL